LTLQTHGPENEDTKGLSAILVEKTQSYIDGVNKNAEARFQAFINSNEPATRDDDDQFSDDDEDQCSDPNASTFSTLPSTPRNRGSTNADNKHWKKEEPAPPPNTIPGPGKGTRADQHQVLPCDDGTVLHRGPCSLGKDWVRHKCKDGIIGEEFTDTSNANPDSATVSPDVLLHPATHQCTGMYLHSGALLQRQRNELLSVPSVSYQKVNS
jgi:hypothetical protein